MGVYIKGMKMPTNCWDCPIRNSKPCPRKGPSTALEYATERHADCPLVPVPPHGGLIDVDLADDYAYDALELANYRTGWEAARAMQKIYRDAPTIIPADKEAD